MLALTPFTEDALPEVQVWFRHPEVQRWLGGPEWPVRQFQLAGEGIGETFRGRRVLRTHSWVARDGSGAVVAQVGGEVYDRWRTPGGGAEPGPALGMAYVVDPLRWRRGIGTATLRAVVSHPEVADVVLFAAGIEPENVASTRCAVAAGLLPDSSEPDDEGIVHYVLRRGT